ncbi:hypothetical protein [Aliagarivorans taiwanensis]|uniref:hypothetical protein n=1 Tax=Aliagarivorans taiwanensis TaxID=561966 RepID=UPI0004281DD5|nr:hypothetical protein [Aliagarivorans taiwanensis]
MFVNYNLGAASFESPYAARQRIERAAPRQTITEYSAARQTGRPGTPVFGDADVQPGLSPEQLRNTHDAKVANRKSIREAMNRSVQDSGPHIRLYREYADSRGQRGPQMLARA